MTLKTNNNNSLFWNGWSITLRLSKTLRNSMASENLYLLKSAQLDVKPF